MRDRHASTPRKERRRKEKWKKERDRGTEGTPDSIPHNWCSHRGGRTEWKSVERKKKNIGNGPDQLPWTIWSPYDPHGSYGVPIPTPSTHRGIYISLIIYLFIHIFSYLTLAFSRPAGFLLTSAKKRAWRKEQLRMKNGTEAHKEEGHRAKQFIRDEKQKEREQIHRMIPTGRRGRPNGPGYLGWKPTPSFFLFFLHLSWVHQMPRLKSAVLPSVPRYHFSSLFSLVLSFLFLTLALMRTDPALAGIGFRIINK